MCGQERAHNESERGKRDTPTYLIKNRISTHDLKIHIDLRSSFLLSQDNHACLLHVPSVDTVNVRSASNL